MKTYLWKKFYLVPNTILKSDKKKREYQINKAIEYCKEFPKNTELTQLDVVKDAKGNTYSIPRVTHILFPNSFKIQDSDGNEYFEFKATNTNQFKNIIKKLQEFYIDIDEMLFKFDNKYKVLFEKMFDIDYDDLNSYINTIFDFDNIEFDEDFPISIPLKYKEYLKDFIDKNVIRNLYIRSFIGEIESNQGLQEIVDLDQFNEIQEKLQESYKALDLLNYELKNLKAYDKETIEKKKEEIKTFIDSIARFFEERKNYELFVKHIGCKKSAISHVLLFALHKMIIDDRRFNIAAVFFEMSCIMRSYILEKKERIYSFLALMIWLENLDEKERDELFSKTENYISKNILTVANIFYDVVPVKNLNKDFIIPKIPDFKLLEINKDFYKLSHQTRISFNLLNNYFNELDGKKKSEENETEQIIEDN